MLKRRAKIRVKPVISSAPSSSIVNDVEESVEKEVVAIENPQESEQQERQLQEQQHEDEDRTVNYRQQIEIENKANDSVLEITSETVPDESSQIFDESIVDRLDQACNRLNSTTYNETLSHENNSEKAPLFDDYVSIPIIFSDKNDRSSSTRPESPRSTSEEEEEEEEEEEVQVEMTRTSKTSILSNTFDRKRAAERLANKLVKQKTGSSENQERPRPKAFGTLNEPVNSSQLCMRDLIYLNPRDNPMSTSDANEGRTVLKEATVSEEKRPEEEEEHPPVPQLEIGPDGNIVINEASLVIQQKSPNFDDMMVVDDTNYFFDGYKSKKPRSKKWGMKETKRFYAALSMIGTDFSLISKLLPNRTRDEIKNKFKSEDRKNRTLIDTALKVKKPLDISLLAEPPSDDDLTDEKPPKKKKPRTRNDKPANSQKKPRNQKEDGDKSAKKTQSRKRKVGPLESSDESSEEVANGEGGTKSLPGSKKKEAKRRKVIEDEDTASAGGEAPVENPVPDPYDFDGDTDVEYDIEITKFTQKRNASRILQRLRPSDSPGQPAPEEVVESPSLQEKFSQQLEQMEIDQKRSELKSIDEGGVDSEAPPLPSEGENIQEDCQKLFNQLPSTKKSRKSINIIDHNSINLEELGIGDIPPNHRLVVVSTPLKEGLAEENVDSDQQLLQVFTISESALKSMMEDAKNSTFDPIEALLSLAQGQGINLSEAAQQVLPLGTGDRDGQPQDEDSRASSDIDANMLDGLISMSDDFPGMLSPPKVQNELFLEDVKVLPCPNGPENLGVQTNSTAQVGASSETCPEVAS